MWKMQNIDIKKAVGSDVIPNAILKRCAKETAQVLVSIFNTSLETGFVPKD